MKVGVITRHAVPNYGSLLQSYATEKALEKMGYDAEIIDYCRYDERAEELSKSLVKGKKWDKNVLTRMVYNAIQMPNYSQMYKKFASYRNGFLKMTDKEYGSIEELKKDVPQEDVYCSGSDQIWGRIGQSDYDEAYFLEFAKGKKCISYASSFGKTELSEELDKNLNNLLEKYSKILVREKSAKEILLKHNITNVEQVVDPTFLLSTDEWNELTKKSKLHKKGKYILVYQLHENQQFDNYAKKFSKMKKMKLLRISPSFYHITRSGKLIYLPNQYDFLWYFQNADYILTDSFHATVFSIIFNKKFIDILPLNKTGTRIESVLELFEIENRILQNYENYDLIDNDINYDLVNKNIKKEREKSLEFLKEAIMNN